MVAAADRTRRMALLAILAFGSIMLWQNPIGAKLLYPFTILSTWFHEMGHGLMAMLVGGRFESLAIYADGSGAALSSYAPGRLTDALIAAGGPFGPALAGAALILASRHPRSTRIALAVLAGAILLSTLIWVRSLTGWLVLPPIALVLGLIAARGSNEVRELTAQFVGVQAAISTYRQTGYLFSQGGVVGGLPQRSDTQAMADALLLPYWFWGGAITVAIALLLWWSLRRALR
ncbi:M50 family metallopeptidase [Qipengyuania oceanensis]|uniref:M50 family peptidase n=1 Tax=Qipengyuania oceanensis TaxID=1463597 RepID=A0A844YDD0_9SPHN|nr:M50 family metallopeptidase [Qipengyuania oceanensis]MXO61603.1 M50 family peptidase [Qipengyuania oceanensis]